MTIRSMTGYGQGAAEDEQWQVQVELRSLNNRFADVRVKLPGELIDLEAELRRLVLRHVRRGRVDLSVTVARPRTAAPDFEINEPLVQELTRAAERLAVGGLAGALDVNSVLSLPGVVQQKPPASEADRPLRALVLEAARRAVQALDAERTREGEHLAADLRLRVARMREIAGELGRRAGEVPALARRKLLERIGNLTEGTELDEGRLEQEAALLADRGDVTEELVRLDGHLEQLAELLGRPDGDPVGKRLEFLLQEVHRENNTVGSKSADLELSRWTIEMKAELEKVREQIQNLE